MQGNPFLARAREGKNAFWRYLVTIVLVVLAFLGSGLVLLVAAILITGVDVENVTAEMPASLFLVVNMLPFGVALLALGLGLVLLHQRPFRSLITPGPRIRWRRLFLGGAIWLLLSGLSDVLLALLVTPGNYVWHFDWRQFLPFALLTLLLIPVQSSTEELFMRGYLLQAIGRLTRFAWIPWLLSSLFFAALHSLNPEIEAYGFGVMILGYLSMGLFLGWLTLRYAGLEIAIGVHIANNLYASLLVTFPNSAIPSPALWNMRTFSALNSLIALWGMILLFALLLRWLLPRVEARAPRESYV